MIKRNMMSLIYSDSWPSKAWHYFAPKEQIHAPLEMNLLRKFMTQAKLGMPTSRGWDALFEMNLQTLFA